MNRIANSPSGRNRRASWSPWPMAIAGAFALFISSMAMWILFAVRQDMDLVRKDYYEEEIRFQRQIDRVNRTLPLHREIAAAYDSEARMITLRFPAAHQRSSISGHIQLYRPSNAALDRQIPLATNAGGVQELDASTLAPGLWKLRLFWTSDRQEYFFEQSIVVEINPLKGA